MLNWIKATYNNNEVDMKAYITTMEFVGMSGVYNVYKLSDDSFVTTFNNQPSVRNYVDLNLGSIFMIRFLNPDNGKYTYTIELNKKPTVVYTIARIVVLVQGSEEVPRKLHYASEQLAYIE
jgi:hypothetical protein